MSFLPYMKHKFLLLEWYPNCNILIADAKKETIFCSHIRKYTFKGTFENLLCLNLYLQGLKERNNKGSGTFQTSTSINRACSCLLLISLKVVQLSGQRWEKEESYLLQNLWIQTKNKPISPFSLKPFSVFVCLFWILSVSFSCWWIMSLSQLIPFIYPGRKQKLKITLLGFLLGFAREGTEYVHSRLVRQCFALSLPGLI